MFRWRRALCSGGEGEVVEVKKDLVFRWRTQKGIVFRGRRALCSGRKGRIQVEKDMVFRWRRTLSSDGGGDCVHVEKGIVFMEERTLCSGGESGAERHWLK